MPFSQFPPQRIMGFHLWCLWEWFFLFLLKKQQHLLRKETVSVSDWNRSYIKPSYKTLNVPQLPIWNRLHPQWKWKIYPCSHDADWWDRLFKHPAIQLYQQHCQEDLRPLSFGKMLGLFISGSYTAPSIYAAPYIYIVKNKKNLKMYCKTNHFEV